MKALRVFVVAVMAFIVYIVFSGSVSVYDLISGVIVSLGVAAITASFTIQNPVKALDPRRWAWLIAYALHYFFIDEVKAHLDVMYRILHPKLPVRPAIVKVPYRVETDYAITAVANSITNTPGTIVVDIDTENKSYFVHWIYAETLDPEKAREKISLVFENFAKKVFD